MGQLISAPKNKLWGKLLTSQFSRFQSIGLPPHPPIQCDTRFSESVISHSAASSTRRRMSHRKSGPSGRASSPFGISTLSTQAQFYKSCSVAPACARHHITTVYSLGSILTNTKRPVPQLSTQCLAFFGFLQQRHLWALPKTFSNTKTQNLSAHSIPFSLIPRFKQILSPLFLQHFKFYFYFLLVYTCVHICLVCAGARRDQ